MARIICGPIIGAVGATTARVLVEVDEAASGEVVATAASGHRVTAALEATASRRVIAVTLEGLHTGETYALSFNGISSSGRPKAEVRPFDGTGEINLVAVSCNDAYQAPTGNPLWKRLAADHASPGAGRADVVLHLGDQIYGDRIFNRYYTQLYGQGLATWNDHRDAIEADYRALYRRNWNAQGTRDVLARASNLMIWDDHEVTDDWADRNEYAFPASLRNFIANIAWRVYRDYQRQLWDAACEPRSLPVDGAEYHAHRWGRLGLVFLDVRGPRSRVRNNNRYLGDAQWDWFRGQLAGFANAGVTSVIIASSVPIVYADPAASVAGVFANDLRGHWSYSTHHPELLLLMNTLKGWHNAGGGQRHILLLGGDVHCYAKTDVEYGADPHDVEIFATQLITSGVTRASPRWYEWVFVKEVCTGRRNLSDWPLSYADKQTRYWFKHTTFERGRNYGGVRVRADGRFETALYT